MNLEKDRVIANLNLNFKFLNNKIKKYFNEKKKTNNMNY